MAMREFDMDRIPDESVSMQMRGMEEEPMQSPVEMIKQDHRKVESLFEQFEGTQDKKTKLQVAEQICNMLTVHAELEEELIYPLLKQEEEDTEEEAQMEHELIKFMIGEIKGVRDKTLEPRMKVLKELVEHHVEEEESDALPKLEHNEELTEMMPQIMKRKEQLEAKVMRKAGGSRGGARGASRGGSTSRSGGRKVAARTVAGGKKTASTSKRGGTAAKRGTSTKKSAAKKSTSGRTTGRSAAGRTTAAKKGARKSAAVRSGRKSTSRRGR